MSMSVGGASARARAGSVGCVDQRTAKLTSKVKKPTLVVVQARARHDGEGVPGTIDLEVERDERDLELLLDHHVFS